MKFLHTGDWQLGMKAASVGQVGQQVRAQRLEAGKRVVEVARTHQVDCILVAGDLFEDNGVSRLLVQQAADILGAFPGPVYIIPGNHDPLVPGSVWEHNAWERHDNLHVLRKAEPLTLPGGTCLFPCPLFDKYSRKNPTAWIDTTGEAAGIRIGLAHGTVEGVAQDEPDYPIPRDAAEQAGLDYLALGHWHSKSYYPDSSQAVRMAYSGTHETSKFGERESGNVLVVEIDAPGDAPRITPVRTGGLSWLTWSVTLQEQGDLKRQLDSLLEVENPEKVLLELRLSGLLPLDEEPLLREMRDIAESRFLFARLETSGLLPSPEDDSWIMQLPAGIMQQTATALQHQASTALPETEEAQIATLALFQLFRLSKEI